MSVKSITVKVRLAPRELEVLRLMADGLQDKEIAARLGIALRTVKEYAYRLRMKSGLDERSGPRALVAWAFRAKLVK